MPFDFKQVQQAPDTLHFRPCCHGLVEILNGLAASIREGNTDAKTAKQSILEALQKSPSTVTAQDALDLKAALGELNGAMASKPDFSETQNAVTLAETYVSLHIKAAEAGARPTHQQSQELGQIAVKLQSLVNEHAVGSNISPSFSQITAHTEGFIKQAQEANPYFGLSMASSQTSEASLRSSEPAAKGAGDESRKEPMAALRSSPTTEASKNPEVASKERSPESSKAATSEVAKSATAEIRSELGRISTKSQVESGVVDAQRQSAPNELPAVATVTRVVSTSGPSPTPALQNKSFSQILSKDSVAMHSQSSYSVSQSSSQRHSSGGAASSVPQISASSAAAGVGRPTERVDTRTVQRVFSGGERQARTSSPFRTVTTGPNYGSTSRAAQAVRSNGNSTSVGRRDIRGVHREGVVKIGREKGRSEASESAFRNKRVSSGVQQLKSTRQGKQLGTQTQKSGFSRDNARGGGTQRSSKSLKAVREITTKARQLKPREVSSRGARLERVIRMVRERGAQGRLKTGRDGGPSIGGKLLRSQERGASLSMARIQRVVSLLKHLRSLSASELKGVKPASYDRPGEMKTALAIRQRAHKLMEKAQGKPLKELAGLGTHSRIGRGEGSRRGSAQNSVREMLARREVRAHIRNLERRLQNFLPPGSQLYKRLTTELTLADLERLVSIIGGTRALRGLKRKRKAGELGVVQEADVSNTFLSQLETAARGGESGADSGGGSEDSEVSTGAAQGIESETVVVAEGATPTATLTTAIVKEEDSSGVVEKC